MTKQKKVIASRCWWLNCAGFLIVCLFIFAGCGGTGGVDESGKVISGDTIQPNEKPLNLAVFIDLSDRIKKDKDKMSQSDKDQLIINELADKFIDRQIKRGFGKSTDNFEVLFYPAPDGAQSLSESLNIDLASQKKTQEKKRALKNFKDNHSENLGKLYENALQAEEYFGSDIWGFFNKGKINDLYRDGYRNVLVILSDGYIFDVNNKVKTADGYSYLLPQTLAVDGKLIPCKIENPDIEIYFMECNANPQTDYPKMKETLENWFKEMGVKIVDVQDTDLPANVSKHLSKRIFQ
ncbi:MAG: hypothetical protein HDS73_01380 [Bacteroidales bacterium]|nr:hypothetical protein [Bacteroidales bacterium]